MESPFRDTFRIQGFRFGEGEKSLALVGAMRGNEIQQQYICSQVINRLAALEKEGRLVPGHEILVVPSANPFSMNIEKRFWAMDNTDINRMFPGYDQGETTQRIAAALFDAIQGYTYGIQLASFTFRAILYRMCGLPGPVMKTRPRRLSSASRLSASTNRCRSTPPCSTIIGKSGTPKHSPFTVEETIPWKEKTWPTVCIRFSALCTARD